MNSAPTIFFDGMVGGNGCSGKTLNLVLSNQSAIGTIVPKGQKPAGGEGNREIFVVKKILGAWKFYRYIFNAEVSG